jgi:hypothetical protein
MSKTVRSFLEVERGRDGVVVGGARVAALDLEFLEICNCHRRLPSSDARIVRHGASRRRFDGGPARASLAVE